MQNVKIQLETPLEIPEESTNEDGQKTIRMIKQDYIEFSRIRVQESRKYLPSTFISKVTSFQDRARSEIYEKFNTEDDEENLEAGILCRKMFFEIFDSEEIIKIIAALTKLPLKVVDQLDLLDITSMYGDIIPFFLPSQSTAGSK